MDQFTALKTFYLKKTRRQLTAATESIKTLVRLESSVEGGNPDDYTPALCFLADLLRGCDAALGEREPSPRVDPYDHPEAV